MYSAYTYFAWVPVVAFSQTVKAAVLTAIIAGIFSVVNTILNGTIFSKVRRIERKQERILELHGERDSDKLTPTVGRTSTQVLPHRERRKT